MTIGIVSLNSCPYTQTVGMSRVYKKAGNTSYERSLEMMKRFSVPLLLAAFATVLAVPSAMRAQDAASLYKSKCAACHAADGTGSAMGKKMGAQDFTSADAQKLSDAELSDIITNGKAKMPAYKSLTADQVKGLVGYIRSLKK